MGSSSCALHDEPWPVLLHGSRCDELAGGGPNAQHVTHFEQKRLHQMDGVETVADEELLGLLLQDNADV